MSKLFTKLTGQQKKSTRVDLSHSHAASTAAVTALVPSHNKTDHPSEDYAAENTNSSLLAPSPDPRHSRPNSVLYHADIELDSGLRSLLDAVDDNDANSLITMTNKLAEGVTTKRQLKSEFQRSEAASIHEDSSTTGGMKNIKSNSVNNNNDNGTESPHRLSENTKLLSDKLKEEFSQKYNNLFQSIDKNDYNPLENLRKRLSTRSESIHSAQSPSGSLSGSARNGNRQKVSSWRLKSDEIVANQPLQPQLSTPPSIRITDSSRRLSSSTNGVDLLMAVPEADVVAIKSTAQSASHISECDASSFDGSSGDEDYKDRADRASPSSVGKTALSHRRGASLGISRQSDDSLTDGGGGGGRGKISRFKEKLRATIKRGDSRGSDLDEEVSLEIGENETVQSGVAIDAARRKLSTHHKKRHSIDGVLYGQSQHAPHHNNQQDSNNSYLRFKYEKNLSIFNAGLSERKTILERHQQPNTISHSLVSAIKPTAAVSINQHCVYKPLLGNADYDNLKVGEIIAQRAPVFMELQSAISTAFIVSNEELLRQQDEFTLKIELTAAAIDELIRADIERLDQLQNNLSTEIDSGLQNLAGLCAAITAELNPRLSDQRSNTHTLLTEAYQLQNRFTELGYTILAFLLRTTASLFWGFAMLTRAVGFGREKNPPKKSQTQQQHLNQTKDTEFRPANRMIGKPLSINATNLSSDGVKSEYDDSPSTSPVKQRFEDLRKRMAAAMGDQKGT